MIVALMRIRNESLIIKDTLDHLHELADFIYIYDDASQDQTVEICKRHPSNPRLIQGREWEMRPVGGVSIKDGAHKQTLLNLARQEVNPEWFLYVDADERFDRSFAHLLQDNVDALVFELYDFYLTPWEMEKPYGGGSLKEFRNFCGPEYRHTLMVFRNLPGVFFPENPLLRCREPWGFDPSRVVFCQEKVLHFGKAISVEQWERKVAYYSQIRGLAEKWRERRGKAIHTKSDFGRPLLRWEELKENPDIKGPCLYRYNPVLF